MRHRFTTIVIVALLSIAGFARAMDTGSGVGHAASEMMKELQKAQEDLALLRPSLRAVFDHDPGSGGPWTAERRAKAVPREVVVDARAFTGGPLQDTAAVLSNTAGRLYFEMPLNTEREEPWADYVCTGFVAADPTNNDRSIIMTSAHCIYDDTNKAFARNVLYIPSQVDIGLATDCENDPIGCWSALFGVVDARWATRAFPDNLAWDYGYYVVSAGGTHPGSLEWCTGTFLVNSELERAAAALFDFALCTPLGMCNAPYGDQGVVVDPVTTCP